MFQRMLTGALFAGAAAGLIAALLHFAFIQQVLLLGEQYESGALVHFDNATAPADGHSHAHGDDHAHDDAGADHGEADGHSHGAAGSDFQRNALTVAFTVLIYVSYAVMLFAGFGLAESMGRRIDAQTGLLWGLTGFAAFQLAPAMGLPPELPGTVAADLGARQVWWWMTVVATGGGVALLAYGRKVWMFVLGGAALALPHVIGAPQVEGYWGVAPPEVGAMFAARVLGVGLAVWVILGWIGGHLWSRGRPA
jgi:cobalt transporter subunit CbtA